MATMSASLIEDTATSTERAETLEKVYDILTKHSSTQTEFITLLYHSLKQISKNPNNSSNTLEAATASIRHRLKTAKSLLQQDTNSIELLSKSPEEWQTHISWKRQELEKKKELFSKLRKDAISTNQSSSREP